MKIGKAHRPSEAYEKIILASGDIRISVLVELCQRIVDEKGMTVHWALSAAIPISSRKGDVINCGMHRGVKLIEHTMKIVEKYLRKNCND